MTLSSGTQQFLDHVQQAGQLINPTIAKRWTQATLQELGINLPKKSKNALVDALPDELSKMLGRIWYLFPPNESTTISALEFQEQVAQRSGNTDKNFAKYPIMAVFGAIQSQIGGNAAKSVYDDLSPELQGLWDRAAKAAA